MIREHDPDESVRTSYRQADMVLRVYDQSIGFARPDMSDPFSISATNPQTGEVVISTVESGGTIRIGRSRENDLPAKWDRGISRIHACAQHCGHELRVSCLESGRGPLIVDAEKSREAALQAGDEFQIGKTSFQVESVDPSSTINEESDLDEFSVSSADLANYEFGDAQKQIRLLCDLPDQLARADSDAELANMVCGILLNAIPEATAVAAMHYTEGGVSELVSSDPDTPCTLLPDTMRVQTRAEYNGQFRPSRRLVGRAFRTGESTIHIWGVRDESGQFTLTDSLNWAFNVPIPGHASVGWCLYVAGAGGKAGAICVTKEMLESDIRFTQLLAKFTGATHSIRQLQQTQTQLASFLSPKVVESLTTTNSAELLTPSERDITVLFCDVRGFSRKSEQHQDNLLYLLDCVKEALGAMTHGILGFDGAIADFQGDAALGFWGWPVSLEEGPLPACRAALDIQRVFAEPRNSEGLLDGFSIGLGIAHGRAVAGQIGTRQQAKVGVFGPVVNQGARIEGLTRHFDVSICIDEQTSRFVREEMETTEGRVRRLARLRPKGMDTPIEVSELLPPVSHSDVTDRNILAYESALDAVIAGDWTQARTMLAKLPVDGAVTFLNEKLSQLGDVPPASWDGAFAMTSK